MIRTVLVLASIFLMVACSSSEPDRAENGSDQVAAASTQVVPLREFATLKARPDTQARKINLTGRLQPLEAIQLVAEVPGKTLETGKILNEGLTYRRGEVMVRIDDRQTRLNLQAQKSQFQSALVRLLAKMELDYPEAHPAWDAYVRNFQADESLPELPEVSDDQVNFFLSANGVFSTYYTIKSAEEQLPKYQIVAPFTGIITQGSLPPASVVNPGMAFAQFSRTDVFELKLAVSTSDIEGFQPGQKISVRHRNTDRTYQGIVHRFGGAIDAGTQSVPVFVRVSGRGLRQGMFLETDIALSSMEGVVELPLNALNRENQVHVIRDSVVVLQEVNPVQYQGSRVWVSGLSTGDMVITASLNEPIVGIKARPE